MNRQVPLMARIGTTVLISVLLLTTSGCWSRKEIDELSFIMAMGLDKGREPGKYIVTFQVALPALIVGGGSRGGGGGGNGGGGGSGSGGMGGGSGATKPVWTPSAEGRTVIDAVRRITEFDPRRGYAQHVTVIIFGEELARDGLLPVLDLFDREPEIRPTILVYVARGVAQRLLQATPTLGTVPAMALEGLSRWGREAAAFHPVTLNELFYTASSGKGEIILPVIYPSTGKVEAEDKTGGSSQQDSPKGQEIRAAGMAVFRQEKLVGFLNRPETRGYLWLAGKLRQGIFLVKAPGGGTASLEIRRARTKVEPVVTPEGVRFRVKIETEYDVAEITGPTDISKQEIRHSLSRRLTATICNEVRAALTRLQGEFQSDVLGWGELLYRRHPKVWRRLAPRWPEVFATLPVEVEIKASFRDTGEVGRPLLLLRKPR